MYDYIVMTNSCPQLVHVETHTHTHTPLMCHMTQSDNCKFLKNCLETEVGTRRVWELTCYCVFFSPLSRVLSSDQMLMSFTGFAWRCFGEIWLWLETSLQPARSGQISEWLTHFRRRSVASPTTEPLKNLDRITDRNKTRRKQNLWSTCPGDEASPEETWRPEDIQSNQQSVRTKNLFSSVQLAPVFGVVSDINFKILFFMMLFN